MGNIVVVELKELRTLFGAYEQLISCLCNVFHIGSVRKSLWNGPLLIQ